MSSADQTAPDVATRAHMQLFRRVAFLTMGSVIVMNAVVWTLQPDQRARVIVSFSAVNGLGLLGLAINRAGRPRLASTLFVFGLIAQATALSFTGGGIRSPGVTMSFVFVLMAGVLLGKRWAYASAILCAIIGLSLVALEGAGRIPVTSVPFGPIPHWILNMVYMTVTMGLVGLATDRLAESLGRTEDEMAQRIATEVKRERLLTEVSERMKEL